MNTASVQANEDEAGFSNAANIQSDEDESYFSDAANIQSDEDESHFSDAANIQSDEDESHFSGAANIQSNEDEYLFNDEANIQSDGDESHFSDTANIQSNEDEYLFNDEANIQSDEDESHFSDAANIQSDEDESHFSETADIQSLEDEGHFSDAASLPTTDNAADFSDIGNNADREISRNECIALAMTFAFRHRLSNTAIADFLKLLNTIRPGCVPPTKYFIEKQFMTDQEVELHYYCHDCKIFIGSCPQDQNRCKACEAVFCRETYSRQGYYFMTVSISDQLRTLFERHDLYESLVKERFTENRNVKNVKNMFSGDIYKAHKDFLSNSYNLSFTFNTDGVPVFASSSYSIWPLYLQINEIQATRRANFTILQGLWFGNEKPQMCSFLRPFVDEMQSLYHNGVLWKGKDGEEHVSKCVCILSIADSPARASLQGIKQFNGEYGCTFCLHQGKRVIKGNGFVNTYPLTYPLPRQRTHNQMLQDGEQAVQRSEPINGVKEISPLFLLPHFDMAKSWSPDYMHSVLLGVVLQVTNLIFDSGNHTKSFYLGNKVYLCDKVLLSMKPPQEISRSPRSISTRGHWKANEWRAFLLFYSLFIFQQMLPTKYFKHWLLLSAAIHILLGDDLSLQMIRTAELCLYKFVCEFKDLYGEENVSFNVHLLTHLADSVRNWGPLWGTSAFHFENENGKLLNLYHGTQHVHKQIMKRFFGLKMLHEFVKLCLKDTLPFVSDMLKDIGGDILLLSPQDQSGVHGAPLERQLTLVEIEVLSALSSKDVNNTKVYSYKRAYVSGRLLTTNSYSNGLKRDNSVIKVHSINAQIYDIVKGKIFCMCVDRLCGCVEETYLLCYKLKSCPSKFSVSDQYTGFNFSSILEKVTHAETIAFHFKSCKTKLFHATFNNSDYIISIPKFEISD